MPNDWKNSHPLYHVTELAFNIGLYNGNCKQVRSMDQKRSDAKLVMAAETIGFGGSVVAFCLNMSSGQCHNDYS